jgi:hypothetical protein
VLKKLCENVVQKAYLPTFPSSEAEASCQWWVLE